MSTVRVLPAHPRRHTQSYDEAVTALQAILVRGLKSIRQERFPSRKGLARYLRVPVDTVINIERGHRRLLAADLLVYALAFGKSPEWVLQELLRRFETEIAEWRKAWEGRR
jgi:DNA-binding transcriptional regulator YiaG